MSATPSEERQPSGPNPVDPLALTPLSCGSAWIRGIGSGGLALSPPPFFAACAGKTARWPPSSANAPFFKRTHRFRVKVT